MRPAIIDRRAGQPDVIVRAAGRAGEHTAAGGRAEPALEPGGTESAAAASAFVPEGQQVTAQAADDDRQSAHADADYLAGSETVEPGHR